MRQKAGFVLGVSVLNLLGLALASADELSCQPETRAIYFNALRPPRTDKPISTPASIDSGTAAKALPAAGEVSPETASEPADAPDSGGAR